MSNDFRREVFRGINNHIYRYNDKGYGMSPSLPPSSPISQRFGFRMPRRQTVFLFLNVFLLFALLHHLTKLPPGSFLPGSAFNLSPIPESLFNKTAPSPPLSPTALQKALLNQAADLSLIPFPKKIWQTWKTISLQTDEDFAAAKSWQKLNPSHEYELLTDKTGERFVVENYNQTDPYIVYLYKNFRQRILAADLLRYLIAYKHGGIYTDIDTVCNLPVDNWIETSITHLPNVNASDVNIVVGMEVDILDKIRWPDSWMVSAGFSQRIQFVQWSIYVKPGHEILRRMISSIMETVREDIEKTPSKSIRGIRYSSMEILDRTGPFRWTRTVQQYVNEITNRTVLPEEYGGMKQAKLFGDVLFLPVNRWSPGVPHSDSGEDATSFLIHTFKSSWKSSV